MTKRPPAKGDHPAAWRAAPRDADQAPKAFPSRAGFLERLRATNRPTTKDLRDLRALKRTAPTLEGPPLDPAAASPDLDLPAKKPPRYRRNH